MSWWRIEWNRLSILSWRCQRTGEAGNKRWYYLVKYQLQNHYLQSLQTDHSGKWTLPPVDIARFIVWQEVTIIQVPSPAVWLNQGRKGAEQIVHEVHLFLPHRQKNHGKSMSDGDETADDKICWEIEMQYHAWQDRQMEDPNGPLVIVHIGALQ